MGYYNMIYQYGENSFLNKCKKSGVRWCNCCRFPWPENINFSKKCKKKYLFCSINFTNNIIERMQKKIIKDSHDMVYYISMLSTTGGKLKVSAKKILKNYKKLKKLILIKIML